MTFGELVAAAYRLWGKAEAQEVLRLAFKSRLVVFLGQDHLTGRHTVP